MPAAAPVRPFLDPARPPTEDSLAAALGGAFPAYRRLAARSARYRHDWRFAGKSGWSLKVHAKGKALYYLVPFDAGFRVSAAIRDNERAALVADPDLAELHDALVAARRFAEGFAVTIDAGGDDPAGHDGSANAPVAERFVSKLIELRA